MERHLLEHALGSVPPLRTLAAALVLGTVAGLAWPVPAVVAAVACGIVLWRMAQRATHRRARLAYGILGLALLAGAVRGASVPPPPAPEGFRETPVVLRGTVEDAPRIRRDAAGGREALLRLRLEGEERSAALRVRLEPGEPPPAVGAGDALEVSGRCTAPRAPTNPGERDRRQALRRDGVVLRVGAPATGALRVRPGGRRSPLDLVRRAGGVVRDHVLRGLDAAVGDRPGTRAVLAALLVGDRSDLDEEVEADFRRAGAAHLLAVSGLHVVLLVGAVTGLVAALTARLAPGRAGRHVALAASLAFLLTYAAVCRLATPVVRAATFVAVIVVARHVGRRTGTPDHLAAAAALVAAADPAQVAQPGFHLSFSAVLGLCTLTPRFREALFSGWDLLARFPEALPPWRLRLQSWFAAGASASLAASTATAPVTAAVFGELHPAAPLANLLAVPLVGLLLPAAALASLVGSPAEPLLGPLLEGAVTLLTGFLAALAALPGATTGTGDVPGWAVAASVLLLVAAACARPWRRRHLAVPALCWALLALAPGAAHSAGRPDVPSVVALDVGHGVALLLRGGDGGAVLYDAGGRMPGTAERIVVPALRALGVERLTAVAISHEDADHSAAVPDLLARMPVGVVLVPAGFGGAPAGRRVLRSCARRSVPVATMGRGDTWQVRDIRLRALHPRVGAPAPAENEGSLVLLAELGVAGAPTFRALLPGDLEGSTLDALAADATLPRADVLLLPHHGRGPPEPQIALARRCGARVLLASTPATAPTAVPGALLTGHEGALLLTRDRAPERLVASDEPAASGP